MSIFESLRRTSGRSSSVGVATEVFFRLDFDHKGAFLEVVDAGGKPLQDVDPRPYHGAEHDALKLIETFQEQNLFSIDWAEDSGERLYLAEHEMLLWPLRRCPHFVNRNHQPLRFAEGTGVLIVEIGEPPEQAETPSALLQARLLLRHEERRHRSPKPVTERHWLVGDTLFETLPAGPSAALLPGFSTEVTRDDLPRFLSLLFSYTQHVRVQYAGYRLQDGPPLEARPTLFIEQVDAGQALFLRLSASAPGWPPDWFEDYDLNTLVEVDEETRRLRRRTVTYAPLDEALRDLRKRLRASVRKQKEEEAVFHEEDNLFILEPVLAQVFLHEHLPDLLRTYVLFGAEKLQSYQIRALTPSLNLRLTHNVDFLEGDATLSIGADTLPLFDALQQFRKRGYLQLSDGTRALVAASYFERLERLFQKKQDQVRLSFFDLPLVEELLDAKAAAALPPVRDVFLGFNHLHEGDVPLPDVRATLRPYQEYGYRWLRYLHRHNLGGCLADDMGLGKTLQAIAILTAVYAAPHPEPVAPSLVVMPTTLLFNWAQELTRFAPQLAHYTYHGTGRDLEAALKTQVILTTYNLVRSDLEALRAHRFHYVILDEAQRIKNIDSQTSKAATLLDADHRLALSGTPIENHLGELYALFRFLNPAMFGSPQQFARTYGQPIQRDGNPEATHELRRKIYPFVLRRLKRDVAKELPDRIEQTLYVEPSEDQARFYEQQRLFYREAVQRRVAQDGVRRAQFFIFQALSELRQIASIPEALTEGRIRSPKRALLLEHLQELAAGGRKALIFVNYLAAVEAIGEDLEAAGLGYVSLTGATRQRRPLVEQFQEDPDISAFVMTLKTGGLGLNLTAADTVFLFDPWWNQAAEQQAVDRTHRIGQDKTVFSYRLITRGTIEEKILQLQEQKRALFEQIIAADSTSLKHLDEADLDFIFA